MSFHMPEKFRVRNGGSFESGNIGLFLVRSLKFNRELRCLLSDGHGWEHFSCSAINRFLTWPEMAFIKSLFWDAEDTVVQLHPPESTYVAHQYCLHLWRKAGGASFVELPPSILVGVSYEVLP